MSQSNPISNLIGGGPAGGAQNPFQIVGGGPSSSPAPQSPFETVGNQSPEPAPHRQQSHIPQPRQQVQHAQAPENPFQIVQEAQQQARPQPAPTGQLSQQPQAAGGGFEMKGFPPGPAPMNQLDTLGSEEPAPAADPFAGMDLPQISEGAPDPVSTVMEPPVEEPTSDFSAPVSEPVQESTSAPTPPVTAPLEPVQQQIPTPPPTAVLEPVQQTPTPPPTAALEPFQQQQTPTPPPTAALEPFQQQQTADPEPSPKAEAKPFVPSKPSASATVTSEIKQLELRAIFGVDHELSHQEIMQRARGLPGIAHVSEVTKAELTALDTLREVASKLGLEDEDPIVMSCPQGFIDFLTCEGTTLAILRKNDYPPGVRETLFIVARELDKL